MRRRPATGLAARILAVGSGLLLALLTLESASRWYYNYRSVPDPEFGMLVPAGHTVRSMVEGFGVAHFEHLGVRHIGAQRSSSGTTVVCVGDSFTEAFQVTDDEMFTTVAEAQLRARGIDATLLAFGRSTWSVADYIASARALRARFAPEWTIVQVQDHDFEADAWDGSKTHFTQDGTRHGLQLVTVVPAARGRLAAALVQVRNQSALIGFLHARRGLLGPLRAGAADAPGNSDAGSVRPPFPVADELRMLRDAFDGRLTILLLEHFNLREPDARSYGEVAILDAARELGVSVATTRDEYPGLAGRRTAPFGFANTQANTGHLNADGHAAAARVLSKELARLHAGGRLGSAHRTTSADGTPGSLTR